MALPFLFSNMDYDRLAEAGAFPAACSRAVNCPSNIGLI